jgi:hypothetical protein
MARIYAGDLNSVDPDVLDRLKALPIDYRVFASFQVGREVDFMIARANPSGHSALIVTELKRYSRRVRGAGQDSEWEMETEDGSWVAIESSKDRNPYWQAVNTVNAVNDWLENNQMRFLTGRTEVLGRDEFRCWPDLLILSPPGVVHGLPLRPTSRFGAWFFDLERWLRSVQSWSPTKGVGLSIEEIDRIGEALGLSVVWEDEGTPEVESHAEAVQDSAPDALATWLKALVQRVSDLEARVHALESKSSAPPPPPVPDRKLEPALTEEEKHALVQAIEEVAQEGKVRAAPTVLGRMDAYLGYSLKARQYNGFGMATRLLEQAASEGVIKFGRKRGPNNTIYLPDEEFDPQDVPL